jgi:hypothetical protein
VTVPTWEIDLRVPSSLTSMNAMDCGRRSPSAASIAEPVDVS